MAKEEKKEKEMQNEWGKVKSNSNMINLNWDISILTSIKTTTFKFYLTCCLKYYVA
jgi:hypothetical protein